MTDPLSTTGPRPYTPPARPTNIMAIISLVAAFVAPVAGLVLGIVAQRQIAQTGEDGASLARAGAIIGGVLTALGALFFIVWLIMFVSIMGMAWTSFPRG